VIVKKYIAELLRGNDCVIVPGFGAFIKHYESASIHPITHKFTPPYKVIGFNGRLRLNDNLLQKHIAFGEQCDDQQALHLIQFFIHSLKQHINQYGFFEFENVGRFFLNQEGILQFDPELTDHFSDETFGLKEFIVQPIDRTSYAMTTNPSKKSNSSKGQEAPKKSNALKVVLIAFSVLTLLGAGGFFVLLEQKDHSIAGIDLKELLGIKEEVVVTVDSTAIKASADSLAAIATAEAEAAAAAEANAVYYVVLGSFQNNEFAQEYSNKLNNKGATTTVISGDNGYFRVGIDASADKEEALKKRTSLLKKYGKSIWLLKH
jgi:flagellar basal body-associated protein FliL